MLMSNVQISRILRSRFLYTSLIRLVDSRGSFHLLEDFMDSFKKICHVECIEYGKNSENSEPAGTDHNEDKLKVQLWKCYEHKLFV